MRTITLKSVPDDVHELLRMRAARHRRSLNSEILTCIEAAVRGDRIEPEAFLVRARALRRRASGRLTDRDLAELRSEGRP